jgi:hypothetical protein
VIRYKFLSSADTQAVLLVFTEYLSEGKIVCLGDFGAFQISVSSKGAETEANLIPRLIKGSKVVFRPGTESQGNAE